MCICVHADASCQDALGAGATVSCHSEDTGHQMSKDEVGQDSLEWDQDNQAFPGGGRGREKV